MPTHGALQRGRSVSHISVGYSVAAVAANDDSSYFYFGNVGQCGGSNRQNVAVAEAFIASAQAAGLGNLGTATINIPSARQTTLTAASTYGMGIGPSQAALIAAGVPASIATASTAPAIGVPTAGASASSAGLSSDASRSQLVSTQGGATQNQTQGINAASKSGNFALAVILAACFTFFVVTF